MKIYINIICIMLNALATRILPDKEDFLKDIKHFFSYVSAMYVLLLLVI